MSPAATERPTRRVAVASAKGGVGKTTVALNLAVALAARGRPVLLCDLDPQGSLGFSLAKGDAELRGLAELLMGEATPGAAVLETQLPGLRLLPRGALDACDACEFEQALFAPGVLDGALAQVERDDETLVLDTPSGLGLVTRAALAVSDFALVPFQTEPLALRSLGQVLRVVEQVQARENPRLKLLGILPTLVDKSGGDALDVLGEVWAGFPGVLESILPRAEAFVKASREGVPVSFLAGPESPEARRFEILAAESELLMQRLTGREAAHAPGPVRRLL